MINNEEFSKRLQKVMSFYGETASSFAEKIGVQRSSISHILSGRNRPSLEFVMKVLAAFPEVHLYWLLNGKGTFPSIENQIDLAPKETKNNSDTLDTLNNAQEKDIERIVIFYSDGTFKNFQN